MLKFFARAIFASGLLMTTAAHAAWPERAVTLIVPYAPGGITDVMARLTAEVLREKFHQTFIVQNEAGAGGIIGAANAARAKPDGYTLFFGPIALLTLSPLTSKVSYDPEKDFIPVSIVASTSFVVTINDSFPAKTLSEFIAEVKRKPGAYSYASAGIGSTTHAASLLFLKSAGLDMVHVPYRGVAPAFTDLIAGNVQMTSASPVELKPSSQQSENPAARHQQQGAVAASARCAGHLRDRRQSLRIHPQRDSCAPRNAAGDRRFDFAGGGGRCREQRTSPTSSCRSDSSRLAARPPRWQRP